MTIIRQQQIDTGVLKLKQLKNRHPELSGNEWMYVVEFPDGDRLDPRSTKQNAQRLFDEIAEQRSPRQDPSNPFSGSGGGLFGNGGLF